MFFCTSGRRVFAAVALVASTFFLALPAAAADGREGLPGVFELFTRAVDGLDGWLQATLTSMTGSGGPLDHEGPYVDPNGGGRTGCEYEPGGCAPPGSPPSGS